MSAISKDLTEAIQCVWSIIRELDDISGHVRNDFKGISSEYCANSIDSVVRQYQKVMDYLYKINPDIPL